MEETPKQGFTEKLRRFIKKQDMNEEEVLAVVKEFENQGVIEADEAEMISNVMEFSDTYAGDIMTHRTRIIAIEAEETVEEALRFMLEENHSRYPLYSGTIDNITGILYLKDMMTAYMNGRGEEPVTNAARKPLYVPEAMPIDTLFEELRGKRTHLAVVIDEYGQTAGIVSIEDIIEEIVGDILDEYDEEEENVSATKGGRFSIPSDIKLDEVAELLHIEISEEDYNSFDTLNGLLISLLGHIPSPGEKGELVYSGYRFDIYSEDGRIISSIDAEKVDVTEIFEEET